jgi:hypothetical protein
MDRNGGRRESEILTNQIVGPLLRTQRTLEEIQQCASVTHPRKIQMLPCAVVGVISSGHAKGEQQLVVDGIIQEERLLFGCQCLAHVITFAQRPELRRAGRMTASAIAELERPSRVACSDLLDGTVFLIHKSSNMKPAIAARIYQIVTFNGEL